MSIQLVGKVGPQTLSDGADAPFRLTKDGGLITQALHGRYFEQMQRENIFTAANQAAQAISVALATAYTGLCLYNPVGSGKLLALLKAKFALSLAPAAIAPMGIIAGYAATGGVTAQTSLLTPACSKIGSNNAPVAKVLNQATIVTPVWQTLNVDGFTAAALPPPSPIFDFEGMIGILPGGFIAFGALTAVTGLGFMSWEEIPL